MAEAVAAGFAAGDVVYIAAGPFIGYCGVVREVDPIHAELELDIPIPHGRCGIRANFDEVEWA
jgi:transcription antitermination factor NusG